MSVFSERITDIMAKKNLNQKQLAKLAHVTESAMSYYVKGERTPRADVLRRLAGALGVTADYLLGETEVVKEPENKREYLQRLIGWMNDEQLYKTEGLLRIVFDDLFKTYDLYVSGQGIQPVDFREWFKEEVIDPDEPPVIKFYADVTNIDKTGITFSDGSKIDFAECAANNIKEDCKMVAARKIDFDPPYFDFTTTGAITRLVFCSTDKKLFKRRTFLQDFLTLQFQINDFGYRTYDLS